LLRPVRQPTGTLMLEYVFFDPRPRQRFVDFLRARGIRVDELDEDDVCGVGIPEDTDDELPDEIEACYRAMGRPPAWW